MTDLTNIVSTIREYGESHNMINEFIFIKDEQQLENLTFNYRTLMAHVDSARIPRSEGEPSYEVDLNLFVIDKTIKDDDVAYIDSMQTNLFVLGQLEDYIQQNHFDYDFDMSDVDLAPVSSDEYNLTGAQATITMRIARNSFKNPTDNG
tara:strand:- start:100 stop:546 length:447 start_codon:yes stop_codon:yes gene_type:complete